MAKNFKAPNVINGTHGYVEWDGARVYEASSASATLKTNRENLQFAGEMVNDTKLMSLSGEFSIKLRKVFSRSKELVEQFLQGKDPRSEITINLQDPDAIGYEKVTLHNCWFNDLPISSYESGKLIEEEYSGGFTSITFHDSIIQNAN